MQATELLSASDSIKLLNQAISEASHPGSVQESQPQKSLVGLNIVHKRAPYFSSQQGERKGKISGNKHPEFSATPGAQKSVRSHPRSRRSGRKEFMRSSLARDKSSSHQLWVPGLTLHRPPPSQASPGTPRTLIQDVDPKLPSIVQCQDSPFSISGAIQ